MRKPMMKTLVQQTALALALVAGSFTAQAQEHGHRAPGGPGGRHGDMMMHMMGSQALERVGATEAQRAQVRQIMDLARQDLKASHETGRKLHGQMRDALLGPQVDVAQLEVLRQQQLAQHDAASRRMLQAMADAARVLSPEQRAKLADGMKKLEAHRAERMKDRMKDGGPRF